MIYLASPYSADPTENHRLTMHYAARFATDGARIYSPILHWHETAALTNLPTDAEFWWEQNQHFLSISAALWVLTLPGWRESVGVRQEMDWWREHRRRKIRLVGPEAE